MPLFSTHQKIADAPSSSSHTNQASSSNSASLSGTNEHSKRLGSSSHTHYGTFGLLSAQVGQTAKVNVNMRDLDKPSIASSILNFK